MKYLVLVLFTVLVCATALFALDVGTASAGPCVGGPAACGQNSGLVPFHKDAIAASLIWGKHKDKKEDDDKTCPKMIIWMRPSEYKPKDYLNPTVGGVFSGFNPKYLERVQGGFGLGQLDRSGWSR